MFLHLKIHTWVCMLLVNHLGEGNGTPLQCSCLESPMYGGVWWAAVHGVAKSQTRLSGFTFTFHFHAVEKEMATHSSVLAWRIPGTREPSGLTSMGLHRVRYNWSDLAATAAVNRLQCSGHSLSGTWGCESLIKSVVMKPPLRKPQGQSSLCVLLAPSASGFSGNYLSQIQQEEIKPLVGTLDSRTGASSLCCVHLSFKELMQVELLGPPYPHSKQRFQNIPWRLSRELPPPTQLREPA